MIYAAVACGFAALALVVLGPLESDDQCFATTFGTILLGVLAVVFLVN